MVWIPKRKCDHCGGDLPRDRKGRLAPWTTVRDGRTEVWCDACVKAGV